MFNLHKSNYRTLSFFPFIIDFYGVLFSDVLQSLDKIPRKRNIWLNLIEMIWIQLNLIVFLYSSHSRTRTTVEQLNGQLKNKFRCLLGHGLQYRPERACRIITACCVLFNIAKRLRQPQVEEEEEQQEVEADQEADEDEANRMVDVAAVAVRAEIIRTFAT